MRFTSDALHDKMRLAFRCLGATAARIGIRTPVQHAIFSGVVSVVTGVIEAGMSLLVGESEDSSSLLGISIMAMAEITGSLLVLYRWYLTPPGSGGGSEGSAAKKASQRQEVYFGAAIAIMTTFLGFFLFFNSLCTLVDEDEAETAIAGILVSVFGASCSFLLWAYKRHYGAVLRSMVLLADAQCSLCVGFISLSVVAALALEHLVWWADSVTGILLSIYIMREGIHSIYEAKDQMQAMAVGDEGLRLVPLMHERLLDKHIGEETALLEETM